MNRNLREERERGEPLFFFRFILAALHMSIFSFFMFQGAIASSLETNLPHLKKGVNLSHWLWMPLSSKSDTFVQEKDLILIKEIGMDHVRLPVDVGLLVNDWNYPGNLDKGGLEKVKIAISMIQKQGLAVIISPFGDFDNLVGTYRQKTQLFWKALSKSLASFPSHLLFFQVANEPNVHDPSEWSDIQNELIAAIRAEAPQHTIIGATPLKYGLGKGDWGSIQALALFQPSSDTNVIYDLHYYNPFFFTHQGADWTEPVAKILKNVPYPSSPEAVVSVVEFLKQISLDSSQEWIVSWMEHYGEERWNQKKIESDLMPVFEWAQKHKVAVHITEFGVYKKNSPPEDRLAWLRDARLTFEKHNMGWTLWDYAGGFSLIEGSSEKRSISPEVLQALGLVG
jgi:aryl-phospho-beta-D-glucosidase BglC (GH1 family)